MVMVQFETWELVKSQELHLSSGKAWVLQPLLYPLSLRVLSRGLVAKRAAIAAIERAAIERRVRQRTLDHQERVILKNLRQEKMAYLVGRMSKTSAADWGGWVNSGQIGAKSSAGDWVIVSKEANGSLTLSRL